MTKVFLIRHAEAEGNVFRRANGHYDGQIIGRGFLQIEQLSKRFEHERIDAVYSSDLSRTCDTAAAIYAPRGLKLKTDKRLREINMGEWEDRAWGDLEYHEPELCGYFGNDPAKWRIAGSEEYFKVRERMADCISELALNHAGGTIAVFSHGFAIRSLMSEIMGIPSHEVCKIPYCDNTAVALLLFENGKLSIEYQGDNSHLSSDVSTFANQSWWRGENAWHRENLRYMPIDGQRDSELIKLCGYIGDAGIGFAAFLEDEPAGLIGLRLEDSNDEDAGWIIYHFIKPELRRLDFDIQLIGQAVAVLRKHGKKKLRLGVAPENIDFYLKYGFEKVCGAGSIYLMEKNIALRTRA